MRSACFGAGIARCSGSGARKGSCTWRCMTPSSTIGGFSAWRAKGIVSRPRGGCTRPRSDWNAPSATWWGSRPRVSRPARVARPRQVAAAPPARRGGPRCLCAEPLRVSAGHRRRPASDSGRAGSRRDHRTRPLSLYRERRDDRAPRGAARLCAQRDRIADGAAADRPCRNARRTRFRGQHGGVRVGVFAGNRISAWTGCSAPRGLAACAHGRTGAAGQSLRRYRRYLQRCRVRHDARTVRTAAGVRAARRRHQFRPPAHDGSHRAGRSHQRPCRRRATGDRERHRAHSRALSRARRAIRQHCIPAGPHGRHRDPAVSAGATVRRRRLCWPGFGAGLRRQTHAGLPAVRRIAVRGAGARRR